MIVDIVMPKMGESITEGTIIEWRKKVGDAIKMDEIILEIGSDKVDSEQKAFWVNRGYSVDYGGTTYNATTVSNLAHEESLNEDRRSIKVLSSDFLSQFTAEFQEKISK